MTTEVKRTMEISITPTPYELAEAFWSMDSSQQAIFFNRLGEISDNRLCFQLQYVTDDLCLSKTGRRAMAIIGDYAEESKS